MPWIIFGRGEEQAPMGVLPTLDGGQVDLRDFNGRASLALFFPHRSDCPECREVIRRLDQEAGRIRVQGAEASVILPDHPEQVSRLQHVTLLLDEEGKLTRRYHEIFEFDTTGKPMMFILNQFGVPFRAWVDDEVEPDEIMKRLLKYLEAASLLCPE